MVFSIKTARRTNDMGKKKEKHIRKLEKLNEVMQDMVDGEFTGHVKINFSQGGIGRIEKFEEILREDER
jgi:3-dehydroquinate dehydratase